MPQLDQLNWCHMVNIATWACGIFVVYLIKYNFYTWRKITTIKGFLTFLDTIITFQKILFLFLRKNLRICRIRKDYLTQLVTSAKGENNLRVHDYDKRLACEFSH